MILIIRLLIIKLCLFYIYVIPFYIYEILDRSSSFATKEEGGCINCHMCLKENDESYGNINANGPSFTYSTRNAASTNANGGLIGLFYLQTRVFQLWREQ